VWNCQSAVQKADFISAYALSHSLDFLALTETWITTENSATPAALSSAYTFSHTPRGSGRGGGTGLLLTKKWQFTTVNVSHLNISSFEFHAITVTFPITLHVIVIYRPPGALGDFIGELDVLLSFFPSDGTPLTVLGDFNLPSVQSSCLLPLLSSFDLLFNHSPLTHKGGNLLDLVFSRPASVLDLTVTPLHLSDHHFVSFSLCLPTLPTSNHTFTLTTRPNLHSLSSSLLISTILTSLPNPDTLATLPLNSATNTLLSSLSTSLDQLCPPTLKRGKPSHPAPWLSDALRSNRRELRAAERKWRKSKLGVDLHSYHDLLSRFSSDVTAAKTSFYKAKLEQSAADPQ
ncbi:uncharacterized protein LOC134311405, partial [Trichomycterus rosablanca]|uniref:uncharacterized protein LOC134311405 n=1 Tax=Trichomycterus rosablanca TaxID=2290929 RepID=UPI002F35202E